MSNEKQCTSCNKNKLLPEFYKKNAKGSPVRYDNVCKDCRKEERRRRYQNTKQPSHSSQNYRTYFNRLGQNHVGLKEFLESFVPGSSEYENIIEVNKIFANLKRESDGLEIQRNCSEIGKSNLGKEL